MFKSFKGKLAALLSMVTMFAFSTASHAYLPDTTTVLQPAFDSVQTDAESLADIAWPLMIGVTGLVIVMGLGKKLFKKAATG